MGASLHSKRPGLLLHAGAGLGVGVCGVSLTPAASASADSLNGALPWPSAGYLLMFPFHFRLSSPPFLPSPTIPFSSSPSLLQQARVEAVATIPRAISKLLTLLKLQQHQRLPALFDFDNTRRARTLLALSRANMAEPVNGFTSVNHPQPPPPAQFMTPLPPIQTMDPTPTAGVKRKRESKATQPKFYAVRIGKEPGIYHTWNECLDQVRGFPKAMFKSFTTLSDAQKFVNNEETASGVKEVTKWYGVRAGRTPGVYTSWQDVLDQITGWKGPKHKGFKTKWEAEQYVANAEGYSAQDVPVGSIEAGEPAKKAKKTKKGVKDELSPQPMLEQGEYEPGEEPLGHDVEDGFDTNILLDHSTDGARYKTREEREKMTYQVARPVKDAPIRIYTDGSSLSNGKSSAWGGVGVFFGPADKRNISEPLSGTKQTNQRAELMAMVRALEVAPKDRKIVIVSDSKYSIDCVTDWFHNWQRNGWVNSAKKPVENRDLVQKILDQLEERMRLNAHRAEESEDLPSTDKRSVWDRGPGGVRFEWVKGHNKDEGNSAADVLAVAGAREAQELGRDVTFDD